MALALPSARRSRERAAAVALAVAVHVAVLAMLVIGRVPAPVTLAPLVDLELQPPPFTPPTRLQHVHRAGGAPASAPKRAPAASPQPKAALVPPEKIRPPAPIELPAPAPTLLAPRLPDLASPVTGAGAGAATGGQGAGTGTGPGGPGGPVLADPDWLSWPDIETVERHYPRRAYAAGRGGAVVLRCRGTVDGQAKDCRVKSETPRGEGFGDAARELARYFRFKPLRADGRAVETALDIPVNFSVGDG